MFCQPQMLNVRILLLLNGSDKFTKRLCKNLSDGWSFGRATVGYIPEIYVCIYHVFVWDENLTVCGYIPCIYLTCFRSGDRATLGPIRQGISVIIMLTYADILHIVLTCSYYISLLMYPHFEINIKEGKRSFVFSLFNGV